MADVGMVSDDVAARREVADRMAEAARAWLKTLDAEQRGIGQGAAPADAASDNERRRWFYTRPITEALPSISSGRRSSGLRCDSSRPGCQLPRTSPSRRS
jgi:hypothetical protein